METKIIALVLIGILIGSALGYGIAIFTIGQSQSSKVKELQEKISQLQGKVSQLQDRINYLESQLGPKQFVIGAIFDLSGELGDIGEDFKVATEIAVSDINNFLKSIGSNISFKLIVKDSIGKPEEAVKALQDLVQTSGVKVIIGPMTSAEVSAVKSFADENKIVVISPSSTAPSLAIPNDFIFRTVGCDKLQSLALARLASDKGYKKVIVFCRDDTYGVGLAEAFKTRFEELGGQAKIVKYTPNQPDYSSEVSQLSQTVSSWNADAVLLISFSTDGANIIGHAKEHDALKNVKWMASEGPHGSEPLKTPENAAFLISTNLLGTRPKPPEVMNTSTYLHFLSEYRSKTGSNPISFTLYTYDAVWLAALSIIFAGKYDGETIKNALPLVAKIYSGISGSLELDNAGDRARTDYFIYTLTEKDGKYDYVDVGAYSCDKDSIEWFSKS